MSLIRAILHVLNCQAKAKPAALLKIRNITRGSEIASRVQVADRGSARRKGLLGRAGLSPEEGLWIVPCEAVHTFGMRFPIDLIYLDKEKRVRRICADVGPWRLSACLSAHSVLELAPGTIRKTQTMAGDALDFAPAEQ